MGFPGGAALPLQRIIYGPSIGTAQRVDQTLPGNPSADPGNAGPILLASQAASRCRDRTPAAHRTRRETTLCGGVGMPKEHRPRHGSMGFSPRKRSESPIPKDYDAEEAWTKVDPAQVDEVRVITYTQPSLVTGVPKKKPDLMENRVGGGSIADRIKYARGLLGKEIPVTEFCREGSMVDVAAITKGKGWQGHHTRWGTRLLSHKNSKHRRNIGTLGNFQPGYVRPTVPQGGQFGYHQRTEYNKRILKIGDKADEVTPDGGFLHYGNLRNPYVLLHGSIPGPTKRLIRFRDAARGGYVKLEKSPDLTYISRESKQGV